MPRVLYAKKADADIDSIIAFTKERWSQAQAEKYLDGLVDTLDMLAQRPLIGRPSSTKKPTWRRFEYVSHVIVYQPVRGGIRVQRVMHKQQLLNRAIR